MAGFKSRPGTKELPEHKPMHVESAPIVQPGPTEADFDQIEAYANDPDNASDGGGGSVPDADNGQAAPRSDGRVGTADAGAASQGGATASKSKDADKSAGGKGAGGDTPAPTSGAKHGPAEAPGNRPLTKGEKFDKGLSEAMSPPGGSTPGSRMFGKSKNQRTGLKIAIISAALILSTVGFFLTFPLKLMHIASVLFNNNFRTNDHIEIRAERNSLRYLFTKQIEDKTGHKSNTGRWLHDKMTNMRIEKFKDILAKDGLQMEFDKNNKFLGVRDLDGKMVTDFRDKNLWQQKRAMGELVRSKLSPHRWLQHSLYTKAMRMHAGISFKFWTKDKTKTLSQRMVMKVRKGLTSEVDARATSLNNKDPNNQGQATSDGKEVDGVHSKAWAAWEKTQDIKKAHEAGIKEFRLKALKAVGWTGIGMMYCMLYDMYQASIEKGYIDRVTFLMREGNMIVTMAHHMYTGTDVDFDEFGELMSKFDGIATAGTDGVPVPGKTKAEFDNNANDVKGFTEACAWKRAMDDGACSTSTRPENFNNYNPDLNPAANPDSFALSGALAVMGSAFNMPGAKEVCSVLNSWFGYVIEGAEVVLSIWVGGATTFAAAAAKGILVSTLIQIVVPQILDAATGLAITGSENAVGLVNNADAGLNLSAKDYGRFMGNRAGSNKENYKLIAAAKAEEIEYANDQGWTYRAFALQNNHSLINRVISESPSSGTGMIAAIKSSLTALPSNFIASIFRPRTALAEGDEMEDPYGFRAYVTTDEELNKHDIDALDKYFTFDKVTKDDGTQTTRIEMLGDPREYTPANEQYAGSDTPPEPKADLLHCFTGKFRAPNQDDPICRDLGILTQRSANGKTLIENPRNPGQREIQKLIYCDEHQACGVSYNDDFEKYRLYLKYVYLARAIEGMTTDKDPFAATEPAAGAAAVGPVTGICQTGQGFDPNAPVPPNDYGRTSINGEAVNKRTKFMYEQAIKYAKQLGYSGRWYVVQGSYSNAVAASAGTHGGGGALDISVGGMSSSDRVIAVKALRMAGFAAWNRGRPYDSAFSPHIHAEAIGDKELAPGAKRQVEAYFRHRSGLGGGGADADTKAGYPFPAWAAQECQKMGLGK